MKINKLLIIITSLILVLSTKIYVSASEATITDAYDEDTNVDSISDFSSDNYDEKKGIAIVRLVYSDENGNQNVLKYGYAFFIGDEENTYLISNADTVSLSSEEQDFISINFGIERDKLKTEIDVVIKDDIAVPIEVVTSSYDMNFSLLKPQENIYIKDKLRLCIEDNLITKGTYTHSYDDNMHIEDCMIEDWSDINGIHYFKYNSKKKITKGLPLINENGEVVGIACEANEGNPEQYYALQIGEVVEALDALGIQYNPVIMPEIFELEEAINNFVELKEKDYTNDSWKICQNEYDNAVLILDKINEGDINVYTQEEVNDITLRLNNAMDGLEKAGLTKKKIIKISVIIGSILLTIIIFLIVFFLIKSKKYRKKIKEETDRNVMAKEALKISGRITQGTISNNMPLNRSLGEEGAGAIDAEVFETTVLTSDILNLSEFNSTIKTIPILTRCRTGESVKINSNSFVVGSAKEMVDYCIQYNSGISRTHICIMKFADGYYVNDLDTTNGTYVNNMKVESGRYVKLSAGSVIKMADEEFIFEE